MKGKIWSTKQENIHNLQRVGLTADYARATIPRDSHDVPDAQGKVFWTFIRLAEYCPVANVKALNIAFNVTSSPARNLIVGAMQTLLFRIKTTSPTWKKQSASA